MSNVEEDIKRCEKLIEPQNANWIGITNQLAIAHLIEKVKELRAMCEEYCPKTERIKELEDDLYSANCIIADLTDSIPVQKVKDKIEELKEHYNTDNNIRIYTLKGSYELQVAVLQELLEDK